MSRHGFKVVQEFGVRPSTALLAPVVTLFASIARKGSNGFSIAQPPSSELRFCARALYKRNPAQSTGQGSTPEYRELSKGIPVDLLVQHWKISPKMAASCLVSLFKAIQNGHRLLRTLSRAWHVVNAVVQSNP